MTGTTISNSYVNGVTLANAANYNPVTILAGVTISTPAGPAIEASGTIDWTISNAGTALGGGTTAGSYGIALQGGGTITNLAGGLLSGAYGGVAMHALGTVLNQGTLQALKGSGVLLSGGGSVANDTASGIIGYNIGVSMGATGTVVNQGSIGASQTTGPGYTYSSSSKLTTVYDAGVLLTTGGLSNAATGVISDYFFGIAASGVSDVVNQGQISASSTTIGIGAFLLTGGSATNAASGTILGGLDAVLIDGTAAGIMVNQGSITAANRAGVDLFGDASYSGNAASGTITGYLGILLRGTGQVINAGSIAGGRYGIDLVGQGTVTNAASAHIGAIVGVLELANGTVVNAGAITAAGGGAKGVYLDSGGYVTNAATGTISSAGTATVVNSGTTARTLYGSGILVVNGAGTVVNAGNVASTDTAGGAGVYLYAGGSLTNAVTGTISSGSVGVRIGNAADTVINAGTIIGNSGTAIAFGGTSDLLVLDPGAVLSGVVDAAQSASNALELASAGAAGTLAGRGSFFTRLGSATIDNGASWNVTGAALLDAGGLTNNGQFVLDPSILLTPSLSGSGSITIAAGSTLIVQGAVSAGETIAFAGPGGVLDLGNSAAMAGTIVGYVSGDVINTGPVTLDNTSSITGIAGYGVVFGTGGAVTNAASASIVATYTGVFISGGPGQVVNAGSIGGSRYGVDLVADSTVTNAASGRISGAVGVLINSGAGTVMNAGGITSSKTTGGAGIVLAAGGTATNAATATISSGTGVLVESDPGTVTNFGSIGSSERLAGAGIELKAGGIVTNGAGADINTQLFGVRIYGSGTVLNQGTIVANDSLKGYGAGVWIKGPAEISNASSGTISGGLFAVVFYNQSTLTNAGAIVGTATAVSAPAGYADRLIVVPGATFSGVVSGGNALTSTIASVLELASGSSIGTIAGFGTKYIDLQQVVLDSGAAWSLGGTVAAAQTVAFGSDATLTLANPGSMAGDISGFTTGDTLVLAGVTGVTSATLNGSNQLTVVPGSGPDLTFQFASTQMFSGADFHHMTVGDNTDLTVSCFATGTRIATASGERAVEHLQVGDRGPTRRGALLAVAWLGHRSIDCRHHPRPSDVWPVRVRAGAFGAGMPHHDLLLSPDHAVLVDHVLIPIRYLLNDATIRQDPIDSITYWHVELSRHDVLLAEGLGCESYLDTGNRAAFGNPSTPLASARSVDSTVCLVA